MIPFGKPYLDVNEEMAVLDVIRSGNIVAGAKVRELEEKFAEYVGGKYAVAFNGCTNALRSAIDVTRPGLTMAIPALTYTATASVVVESGRIPVFVDVDLDTFCASKGDIVVHLTGNRAKAEAKIYDSAHRIEKDDVKDSKSIWCYSFYATKNMTTGLGGMAVTNDKDEYEMLKLIQDDGRKRLKKPYYDIELAVGGRDMSDLNAAIGLEQLKKLPMMTVRRNEIVSRYNTNLGLDRSGNHLYPILVNDRDRFIEQMFAKDVQVSVHFLPLHKMTAYKPYCDYSLPNTEYITERIVSLPMFPAMTDDQVDYVSECILNTHLLIK